MLKKWLPVTSGMIFLATVASPLNARENLPTNVSILTRDDFRGRPVQSVADVLDGLTGLNLEKNGSRGSQVVLKIRGASSANRTLILMDGVPLITEFDSQVDLSQIPLSLVDHIEITRGGSSVVYGAEASAGVVNIITARPSIKGLVADVATAVGRDGFKNSNGRFTGRSRLGDITYAADRLKSGGFQQNEAVASESHFGSVSRSFNGKGYWGVDYFYQESFANRPNGTPQPFELWNGHLEQEAVTPVANQDQTVQQAKFHAASPDIADGNFYLTLKQGMRDLELRDIPTSPAYRDEESVSTLADLVYRRHGLQAGVQAQRFKRNVFPLNEEKTHQNSAYATQKWTHGKWTAVPGVRYDKLAESDGLWSPRLALVHACSESWLVSATAGRAFRKPTFNELFSSGAAAPNPTLEPEKSTNYDAGVEWSPAKFFTVRVTGFKTRVSDLITISSLSRYENAGREINEGVETELSIGNSSSRISANWTAQKSQRDTPASAGFVQSAMTPRSLVNVRYVQALPWALTLTNDVRYQSEQFEFDNRGGRRVAPYYTWNSRFSFKLWQADLYIAVENVTNRRYADTILSGLAPQPARTFWGGLSIRFLQ
jgi:vitamin B12 transporter